jgi:hypothetical protein
LTNGRAAAEDGATDTPCSWLPDLASLGGLAAAEDGATYTPCTWLPDPASHGSGAPGGRQLRGDGAGGCFSLR